MRPITSAVLFAFVSLGLATECTVSKSEPWPFPVSSGGSSSDPTSGTDACAQFKDDLDAYQACAEVAEQGECNAVGCPDSSGSSDTGDLISNPGDDLISSGDSGDSGLIKMLKTRASLTCSASETCYQYIDDSLLCYDLSTGDYHDDVGGKGNYLDGTYVGPDDKETSEATASSYAAATSSVSSARSSSSSTATADSAGMVWMPNVVTGAMGLIVVLAV